MTGKVSIVRRIFLTLAAVIVAGFLIPERFVMPVQGASPSDWNADSFWYEPWGPSGVHKGIDIFAAKGTAVLASTRGVVVYSANIKLGGNVLIILGPKWRFHYYAHLRSALANAGEAVSGGEVVGTVGDTGNAAGKEPHLHYVIVSMFPYPWRIDTGSQGWKKMFYLDPTPKLVAAKGSR